MQRKLLIVAALLCCALFCLADQTPQQKYIAKYTDIAVSEMYRSGVPASITLAQGLLESRYGLAPLAAEGNNHFGIKCHSDWKGKTMKVDDDKPQECFRVYKTAEESFRDHSDFLRYQDRYKFLFDYDPTDYKAWAYGLSKAGYATDPAYPQKLITLIETYNLASYDTGRQVAAVTTRETGKATEKQEIPESPLAIEEAVEVKPGQSGSRSGKTAEDFSFNLSRKLYSKNGVPFVYAMQGETYASIAKENNLFLKEILRYNDLKEQKPLNAGDIVYLQAKKNKTRKGLDKYIVENDGEQLWSICQRFAVKEKSIMKLNDWKEVPELREGDTIKLR